MDKIKVLFDKLKQRALVFWEDFKTFDPMKKALTVGIAILILAAVITLFVLLRGTVGRIIVGVGLILFIAGIVIGIKEKSALLLVIILLISFIFVGVGNVLIPDKVEESTTAAVADKSLSDIFETEIATEEETTEAPTTDPETTTEEETTEAPTTTEPETTEAPTTAAPETEPPTKEARDYVVNTHTGKFHYPSCSSVSKIKSYNRSDRHCTRDELIAAGYEPCGQCHP